MSMISSSSSFRRLYYDGADACETDKTDIPAFYQHRRPVFRLWQRWQPLLSTTHHHDDHDHINDVDDDHDHNYEISNDEWCPFNGIGVKMATQNLRPLKVAKIGQLCPL